MNVLLEHPILRGAVLLIFVGISLLVAGGTVYYYTEDVKKATWQADAWMSPVITPEEEKSMDWVRRNTPERETFVTDIFGGEHMMGETLREGTEGGDWAIVPEVVQRMSDVNEFFKTNDAKKAYDLARKYRANYVLIPNRQVFAGFEWMYPEKTKLQDVAYFERVYKDGDMEIYKLR
ncbi:MAG: hypothetical protein V1835_00185 [Candidatus Micrarchaeota archaeon]